MSTRFKSHEAAAYLGYADPTLRESRVTGKLAGVDAPRYQKIGARVFYEKDALDTWLAQFPMTRHTGEYRGHAHSCTGSGPNGVKPASGGDAS